jgi:Protein of unknown function (DUF5133)
MPASRTVTLRDLVRTYEDLHEQYANEPTPEAWQRVGEAADALCVTTGTPDPGLAVFIARRLLMAAGAAQSQPA